MNLFIIPTWYPSKTEPLAGIFTKEQAEAIAQMCPDINVIVSTWGHDDGSLNVINPWKILNVLRWRMLQPPSTITRNNQVWEVFSPTLYWTVKMPFGGAQRIINSNRKNFLAATKQFEKIDLIHAHVSYPGGYVAKLLSAEFDVPYVITEHMSEFPFPHLMRRGEIIPEIKEAISHSKATISVSDVSAKQIESFGFKPPIVIPNMVNENLFNLQSPPTDKFIFFTLGVISERKGIDHLLSAIALWNPSIEDVEFRIGGDGPMLRTYQKMAKDLGIDDRVKWLGEIRRDDVPKYFAQSHAFVLPSRQESFGVIYAEAIASGKPVIATRCGGPESIVNDLNGRLVEVSDIPALAQTMAWMVEHWSEFSPEIIRGDFMQRFSRPAVISQLRRVYENALLA